MSDSMIERSAERLFAEQVDKQRIERVEAGGFDDALWAQVVDAGFTHALAAEAAGGIGVDWSEAYPILRGIGYWQAPLPLAETMVAALLLSLAGIAIPEGPIALIEQGHGNRLRAGGAGAGLRIDGEADGVPWARHCPSALISLAEGGLALVDLRARDKVAIVPRVNAAKLPSDGLRFSGAPVIAHGMVDGLPAMPVWLLGAAARAIQIVGAMEWLLEQSVQYARDRVQFGKPIGGNQAIQQQLAVLAGDTAACRTAARVAAADAPSAQAPRGEAAAFSIAVAKIRAGEGATRATSIAHQVHGAIGFTREHALHFATRRLWSWREEFGADGWWADRLGHAAIAAGARGFWHGLTAKRFGVGR